MINALSAAASGLTAAANRFEKSAQNVVRASVPQTDEPDSANAEAAFPQDLPAAIVDSKTSEISFRANVAVFKTADKMVGSLLDTLV